MSAKLAAACDAAKATQSKFVRARHVLREWHKDREILQVYDEAYCLGDMLDEALDDYSQALADWETAKATVKALVKKAAKNIQKAVKSKR
jgi:hypothetical protein